MQNLQALTNMKSMGINSSPPSVAASSLLTGNVAYWKYDENTGTSVSDSAGVNTGTWHGTLGSQWAAGKINSGGSFNGSDTYVSVPDATSLKFGAATDFTLAAWFKPTTASTTQSIIRKGGNITTYLLDVASSKLRAIIADGTTIKSLSSNTTLSDGVMYFGCATFSRTGNLNVYLNGAADATAISISGLGTCDTTQELEIGVNPGNPFPTRIAWFTGIIDEVSIWSRVLTPTEITQLYNGGTGLQYPFS